MQIRKVKDANRRKQAATEFYTDPDLFNPARLDAEAIPQAGTGKRGETAKGELSSSDPSFQGLCAYNAADQPRLFTVACIQLVGMSSMIECHCSVVGSPWKTRLLLGNA